jgi:hypothetical protein
MRCGNKWRLARNVRYRTDMVIMIIYSDLYRDEVPSCKSSLRPYSQLESGIARQY